MGVSEVSLPPGTTTVGVVGLGVMGSAIAERLLDRGLDVPVHDVEDLDAAQDHARSLGPPLPVTTQACELHRWLPSRGLGEADTPSLTGCYALTLLPRPEPVAAGGAR